MELGDAYIQQLRHWRRALGSGAHRIGWKLGFTAPELMEKLGIDRPVVGHLTTATLIGADGSHGLAGADAPKAEPEIAILVGPEGSIAGIAPAIEVIDMAAPPDDPAEAVAGNIFHRAVAIASSASERDADGIQAVVRLNGEQRGEADAGAVDLAGAITVVDDALRAAGESLEAGDRIIAGTLVPPLDVAPGDVVELDLGRAGSLRVDFS